jgi:NAD(P)-dependent dehydrogenase (short-subunit alcohol dehydrogenase family)
MKIRPLLVGALLAGLAFGAATRRRPFSFAGRVVLITGARGLGLVMARRFAAEGARLALLARDERELTSARTELLSASPDVLTLKCDIRNRNEVDAAMASIVAQFGRLDVLVNNAGIIQVGPLEHMTVGDFENAMAVHFFGPLYLTLAALPHMRRAGSGRIVNITSVGAKIAVPHLLPYTASKFALAGFSDGLRAEVRQHNIFVTTVCPGLMRTGSPRNAQFKGRHRREYAWFAISDSLPLLSMSAERAAREIVEACRRGAPRLLIGAHVKAAVLANELFPGVTTRMLALANRLLPGPAADLSTEIRAGHESESVWAPSWLTRLNEEAAARNNEFAPETSTVRS